MEHLVRGWTGKLASGSVLRLHIIGPSYFCPRCCCYRGSCHSRLFGEETQNALIKQWLANIGVASDKPGNKNKVFAKSTCSFSSKRVNVSHGTALDGRPVKNMTMRKGYFHRKHFQHKTHSKSDAISFLPCHDARRGDWVEAIIAVVICRRGHKHPL